MYEREAERIDNVSQREGGISANFRRRHRRHRAAVKLRVHTLQLLSYSARGRGGLEDASGDLLLPGDDDKREPDMD